MNIVNKAVIKRAWPAWLATILLLATAFCLMAEDPPAKAYLGVSVESLTPQELKELGTSHGVRVVDVVDQEAAAKAGIQEGYLIQSFNGVKIQQPADLVGAVQKQKPGSPAKVGIFADGKSREVPVTLGEARTLKKAFAWEHGHGGYLGVTLQPLNADLAGYFQVKEGDGVLVLGIDKGSAAEKAGVKAGDVIVRIGDQKVASSVDAQKIISGKKAGDEVVITVIRHGQEMGVNATLDESRLFKRIRIFRDGKNLVHLPEINLHIPEIDLDLPDIDYDHIISDEERDRIHEEIVLRKEELAKHKVEIEEKIAEKMKKAEVKLKIAEEELRKKLEHLEERISI